MTNLEQAIIDKIHRFPPDKQQKILDYAEIIEEEIEGGENRPRTARIWSARLKNPSDAKLLAKTVEDDIEE